MNFGEFVQGKPQQAIPTSLLGREAEINQFFGLCRSVCFTLYQLFALALQVCILGLEHNLLRSKCKL